jgi:hypothetical protein
MKTDEVYIMATYLDETLKYEAEIATQNAKKGK